jgi:hypothetical protein
MPVMQARHLDLLLRILLAVAGGYAFANVLVIAAVRTLAIAPSEVVMWALLFSFLLHALAALWVFAARSAWRACWTLLLPTLSLGAWLWPLGGASPV